jgi:hypothetical protein
VTPDHSNSANFLRRIQEPESRIQKETRGQYSGENEWSFRPFPEKSSVLSEFSVVGTS